VVSQLYYSRIIFCDCDVCCTCYRGVINVWHINWSGVTIILNWCNSCVTVVLQWCFDDVWLWRSVLGQWCSVLRLSQWCHSGVTIILKWCYSCAIVVLQWCHRGATVISWRCVCVTVTLRAGPMVTCAAPVTVVYNYIAWCQIGVTKVSQS
jgi:hypothetical protein